MISVSWKSDSVTAGRTSALRPLVVRKPVLQVPNLTTSPRPKDGSTPSCTAKTRISRMPMRKVSRETPTSEIVRKKRLSQESRRRPV